MGEEESVDVVVYDDRQTRALTYEPTQVHLVPAQNGSSDDVRVLGLAESWDRKSDSHELVLV